ncbi:MAG: flavodoxin [Bacteroidota bacterium]
MSKTIGLFFGTDTGFTEVASEKIIELMGEDVIDKHDVYDASPSDFIPYDYLILGLSTWYDGELQSDWESFFDEFKTIDFKGKHVAIFGLGDQFSYADTFIDGVGIIGKVVLENGGVLWGKWPTEGYGHDASVAELEEGVFCGLAIDEDNEAHLSDQRIQQWVKQVMSEFKLPVPQ